MEKYIKKTNKMIVSLTGVLVLSIALNAHLSLMCKGMSESTVEQLSDMQLKIDEAKKDLELLKVKQRTVTSQDTNKQKWTSLGNFKITHYGADCIGCSGITATGTTPQEERTIAADWDIIPAGSEVMINGNTYVVEDRGGAIKGKVIDVYVGTEAKSIQKGMYYAEVLVKE